MLKMTEWMNKLNSFTMLQCLRYIVLKNHMDIKGGRQKSFIRIGSIGDGYHEELFLNKAAKETFGQHDGSIPRSKGLN